jgi:diacylglycerol O-acyltransferase
VQTGQGLLGFARALVPVRSSSLQGPVGHQRRYRWAAVSLGDVLDVRAGLGGTVNDAVLAAVAQAFRALLLGRGELPDPRAVRTLVPVSVRRADERGHDDNRVSAILADLPVDVADPVACLRAVSRRLTGLKATHEAEAGETVTGFADLMPPLGVAMTLVAATRFPQRVMTTVTTNVPGPTSTLYLCGHRMLATYPYVPIADRVRIGIAVTSYDGSLLFGLTGDRETTADLDVLADALVEAFARLHKAALESSDPTEG